MSKQILIIEDNHDLADSLVDILTIDDQQVTAAMSGKEGLEIAFRTHPDLIILDIRMPDMNGYQVFQKLQGDDWGKGAKVIVLTASESLENISKNIQLPSKYILFKPEVSVAELRKIVTARLSE